MLNRGFMVDNVISLDLFFVKTSKQRFEVVSPLDQAV